MNWARDDRLTPAELHGILHGLAYLLLATDNKMDEANRLAENVGYGDMLWAVTMIGLSAIADAANQDVDDDDCEPVRRYLHSAALAVATEILHSNN